MSTTAGTLLAITLLFSPPKAPGLVECPNHAHVWNIEQCDNFSIDQPRAGNPGSGRSFLGDLVHTLTGGLL